MSEATLFLLCGKIAAGKSTLARRLTQDKNAVLIAQDDWMAALYPGEVKSLEDYRKLTPRLYAIMGRHVQDLLRAGVSVVLDFPANTLETRRWMRSIFEGADCRHELHVLNVPDESCKERLAARNAEESHKYQVSDAVSNYSPAISCLLTQARGSTS